MEPGKGGGFRLGVLIWERKVQLDGLLQLTPRPTMLGRAAQAVLGRTARVPAFRPPQARAFSGVPGKEQLNAAAARAGDEAASLGASIGENVQKLQWWTSAKVRPPGPAASDRAQ